MADSLEDVLERVKQAAAQRQPLTGLLQQVCRLLHAGLDGYDWVGFYMLDPADSSMLILGPYVGAPTEHTRIPVAEGICGAAVAQAATVVVDDVHADPRYISCSIETQSEIVAPMYVHGVIVGEIDIDSHEPARFGPADRVFVENCAAVIGAWMEAQEQGQGTRDQTIGIRQ